MANIFVDFSAANNGDGTAHTQAGSPGGVGAKNTIVGLTTTTGDIVWIRKAGTLAITANLSPSTNNVKYIGWPISTDEMYSSRPAAAQASWDADSQTYAQISSVTASITITLSGTTAYWHRIKYANTNTSTTTSSLTTTNNDVSVRYCRLESSSTNSIVNILFQNGGTRGTFTDIAITHSSSATSTNSIVATVATNSSFRNIVITENVATVVNGFVVQNSTGISFLDCSHTTTGTGTTTNGRGWYITNSAFVKLTNCTANVNGAVIETVSNCSHIEIRNFSASRGKLFVFAATGAMCSANIKSWTQNQSHTFGISSTYTNLSLENVTFIAGNTYDLDINEGVLVTGRNAVFASNPIYNTAKRLNPGVYIGDYNGTLGYWLAQTYQGTMETSAAYRTGGETFSVKMMNTGSAAFYDPALQLGLPCLETIWVSVSAGSRTISIYGAHKGFGSDPPTKQDMWMEFDYSSHASNANRTLATTKLLVPTTLTSDSSTWNNDTSLTVFVMSATVTVSQDCVIPIRVYNGKFVSSAYVYIDPKAVVS